MGAVGVGAPFFPVIGLALSGRRCLIDGDDKLRRDVRQDVQKYIPGLREDYVRVGNWPVIKDSRKLVTARSTGSGC